MSNVQQIYARSCDAAYHREGVTALMDAVKTFVAERERIGDNLAWSVNANVSNTTIAVGTAAANVYGVIAVGDAGVTTEAFVKIGDTTGATNTDAVTHCLGLFGGTTMCTLFLGSDNRNLFGTGVQLWATSTAAGTTAPADPPDVYVLFAE